MSISVHLHILYMYPSSFLTWCVQYAFGLVFVGVVHLADSLCIFWVIISYHNMVMVNLR
jgi:hypothetical protein